MTEAPTAAQIAGMLSERQRAWLIAAEPTLESVPVTPCAEWWDGAPLYVEINGQDYWLGSKSMNSPEGASTFTSGEQRLSRLGLAVRAILMEQDRG